MFLKLARGNNAFYKFLGYHCSCGAKGSFELLFRDNEYHTLSIAIDAGFRLSHFQYAKYILELAQRKHLFNLLPRLRYFYCLTKLTVKKLYVINKLYFCIDLNCSSKSCALSIKLCLSRRKKALSLSLASGSVWRQHI